MRSEICVAWFLMVVLAPISQATPFRLAHTFRPSTPEADNFFGSAVAIDGGVVAIKSDSGYLDGNSVSVTHLFEEQANGGWNEVASFEYDNVTGVDGNPFIGEELAIDAGVVAVGFGDTYTRRNFSAVRFRCSSATRQVGQEVMPNWIVLAPFVLREWDKDPRAGRSTSPATS